MRKRSCVVSFHVDEKELAHLDRQTKASGLSREEYLRSLIMGKGIRPRPCTHHAELIRQVAGLCNNAKMHDFARAAKAHGLLFCPIRDKTDPEHIEIAILQDDSSKASRIIDKLQLAIVDTGKAELIDAVQENLEKNEADVDFLQGSERDASPSGPFSGSNGPFQNSPAPRADMARAKGKRPSVRMELADITAYLNSKAVKPKEQMPKVPVKIKRKEKVL